MNSVIFRSSNFTDKYDRYYENVSITDQYLLEPSDYDTIAVTEGDLWRVGSGRSKKQILIIYCADNEFMDYELCNEFLEVHAQNINIPIYVDNLYLLPIHGNIYKKYNHTPVGTGTLVCHRMTHEIRKKFPCEELSYEDYLKKLDESLRIIVLRGNGPDTHRLWESIEHNCIPIIYVDNSILSFAKYLIRYLDTNRIRYEVIYD